MSSARTELVAQSTNTDADPPPKQLKTNQTQTSDAFDDESVASAEDIASPEGSNTPTASMRNMGFSPKQWGPIESPNAKILNVTSSACQIEWNYQENAIYYITSCIQLFNEANDQQITRHDTAVTNVSWSISYM